MSQHLPATPLDEVIRWIDQHLHPVGAECLPLADGGGRVLAADVVARLNVPAQAKSAMDGFALRAAEVAACHADLPVQLRIVGASLAGHPFAGRVAAGQAVRIMTGGLLPMGTDAVVMVEHATVIGDEVVIASPAPAGKHVIVAGEDLRAGSSLLHSGRRLGGRELAALAAAGIAEVGVHRRPRIRILATGDELVPPGVCPGPHQIVECNGLMLGSWIMEAGGALEPATRTIPILPDQPAALRSAVGDQIDDALLLIGGTSKGAEDHAAGIARELGELLFHGLAIRPGAPAGLAWIAQRPVFLVPGNPVACLAVFDLFIGRAIRRLAGRNADDPRPTISATLTDPIESVVGRTDYVRVSLTESGKAKPITRGGASSLGATLAADGYVKVPAACARLEGDVTVTCYEGAGRDF